MFVLVREELLSAIFRLCVLFVPVTVLEGDFIWGRRRQVREFGITIEFVS